MIMVSKKRLKFWAKQIEIIHIIITILTIASVIIIFTYEKLKIIAAFYLIALYIVQQLYGLCPLTRLKNILLRLARIDPKKRKFVPRFFSKYFHINIPEWLSKFAILLFFILGLFVVIKHFICG